MTGLYLLGPKSWNRDAAGPTVPFSHISYHPKTLEPPRHRV
ncbi:hypothetical protein PHAMO_210267 [Magnetospirillum molischianum DSM 120]|uniref:Uncharacterized protein n=1 Tax=Magnetospirillum molischianum DSM 120 TaxID=1150626 RepID=H8FQW8_MAGML|nr:hypothetical protein PHAMO_210267 [Magnetospirillum molischianum DSM 120]